jgi:hypothetical protein
MAALRFRTTTVACWLCLAMAATGCRPAAESSKRPTATQPAQRPTAAKAVPPDERTAKEEFPRDQGPPLVDNLKDLKQLDREYPVWVDQANRRVVLVGAVCNREGPLELFACRRNSKEYESLLTVNVSAKVLQAGLLAAGAEAGTPVVYQPKFAAPRGQVIDVNLVWNDSAGKRHEAKAQDWVRRLQSAEPMNEPWVFTGGVFYRDDESGREVFAADMSGNLVCLSNFPDSVLDVPIASTEADADLLFRAFTERVPPRGTPVTIILQPRVEHVTAAAPGKKVIR